LTQETGGTLADVKHTLQQVVTTLSSQKPEQMFAFWADNRSTSNSQYLRELRDSKKVK
jgi:hypothetical protein